MSHMNIKRLCRLNQIARKSLLCKAKFTSYIHGGDA